MRSELMPLTQLLSEGLAGVLGGDLVGLYLYGSVTTSDFVSTRSDVDCIAVTEHPLDRKRFAALGAWLAEAAREEPWVERLQMSVLVRDRVLEDDPEACLYQFGVLRRSGSDGNPIIWLDHLRNGIVLYGAEPSSFVPEISDDAVFSALVREVGYLRDELRLLPESDWRDVPSYRAYAVLTLCRIMYTQATGGVTSKSEAARWAHAHVDERFHGLVARAAAASRGGQGRAASLQEIDALIDEVQARLDVGSR